MTRINKSQLTDRVYKRLNGAVPKMAINDAINVIFNTLTQKITKGDPVFVDNFGLLEQKTCAGHKIMNIGSGEDEYVEEYVTVVLIPHKTLTDFIDQKRNYFKKDK